MESGLQNDVLRETHTEQLQNGEDNNDNTEAIVNALGGIDEILQTYFEYNITINSSVKTQIYQIITTPKKYQIETKEKQKKNKINEQLNVRAQEKHITYFDGIYIKYIMDKNNNFFPMKYKHSLYNLVHNKWLQIFIVICSITYMLVEFMWSTQTAALRIILQSIVNIYLIFWLFSTNRKAFKSITKSFEFWFKLYYYTLGAIADIVYATLSVDINHGMSKIPSIISGVLYTVILSLFDGFNMKKWWKVVASGIVAIWWILWSLYYQFFVVDEHIIYIYHSIQISLISLSTVSYRMLGIFFAKQLIWTLFRSDIASFITFKPYLKWTQKDIQLSSLPALSPAVVDKQNKNENDNISDLVEIQATNNYDDEKKEIDTLPDILCRDQNDKRAQYQNESISDTDLEEP